MSERQRIEWAPYLAYLAPFFGFLLLIEIQNRVPDAVAPYFLPLKVALPLALFLYFAARGHLPELRGYPGSARGVALDVAVGVATAVLWVAPYVWIESLRPGADAAFDPDQLGASHRWLALGLRLLGFAVVTPFIEELFLRSFLMRFVDVVDKPVDFRQVAIARFAWRSFLVTIVFFTASHLPWEWPVAVPWVILTHLWFYHRKHIAPLIVVHAVTNLSILLFVIFASGRLHDANGDPLSLWFFL